MTLDDLPDDTPPEAREAIAEARNAREQAEAELPRIMETRRELAGIRRGLLSRVEDSFGVELELALVPRGRAAS